MRHCGVAVVGWGTVGTGVCHMLLSKREELAQRSGADLLLRRVVDVDLERPRTFPVPAKLLSRHLEDVLTDPKVEVVAELVGGVEETFPLVLRLLEAGKHVVTANKALLATRGRELFAAARERGVAIAFEASTAGGVPIIRALAEGLVANRIESIVGVVNGTANFVLTQMARNNMSYDQALAEAQRQGYAERDPTLDVEGIDSAHKLAILARTGMGVEFDLEKIPCQGITGLDLCDLQYAWELGYGIKLLAVARRLGDEVELRVHPALVPRQHPLAWVDGVYNAICIRGDAVGDIVLYGKGAGQMPTASAVVSDLVDMALGRAQRTFAQLSVPVQGLRLRPTTEIETQYYLRFEALDRPGTLAQIAGVLGSRDISILSVMQKEAPAGSTFVPVVIVTHPAKERSLSQAVGEIDELGVVRGPSIWIRMEQ
jgi:homoserine dehydrogenase